MRRRTFLRSLAGLFGLSAAPAPAPAEPDRILDVLLPGPPPGPPRPPPSAADIERARGDLLHPDGSEATCCPTVTISGAGPWFAEAHRKACLAANEIRGLESK